MPTQRLYRICENKPIARSVYRMRLEGDTSALTRPGQFVNIRLDGCYLRRPISVCAFREGELTLIYKVVGSGTGKMAVMTPGDPLDLLAGLGNGFDASAAAGKRIALVGGGVGVPPLYGLMEALRGQAVTVAMGFQSSEDVFYEDDFAALGASVRVVTIDGSRGQKGLVTDILRETDYDYYFACGPQAMLRAVHALGREGQLSFEARMGCGFGVCRGCTCQTLVGSKRICLEGPVFMSGEVIF